VTTASVYKPFSHAEQPQLNGREDELSTGLPGLGDKWIYTLYCRLTLNELRYGSQFHLQIIPCLPLPHKHYQTAPLLIVVADI